MNPHIRPLVGRVVGRSVIISPKKTDYLHSQRSYRSTCRSSEIDWAGYLVDAVVNSGEISSFDQSSSNQLTQDDKVIKGDINE